jgi:hypothetical protein
MAAATYDILIEQGASFGFTLTMNNPDGTVFDLSLWTPRSMMRKKYSDILPTETFHCEKIAPVLPQIVSNSINVTLSPVETAAINAGNYVWDLELYQGVEGAETDVKRILKGQVTVDPEVTK